MNKELTNEHILSATCLNHYHIGSDLQLCESYANYPSRDEYGKVLYLVYNGSLRQFRIKNVVVFPFNFGLKYNSRSVYRNIATLEVAGVGTLYVGNVMYGGNFDFKIYESIDDYKSGKEYKMKYTSISKTNVEKRFGFQFVDIGIFTINVPHRWHWNGTCACLCKINEQIPISYLVQKDGISFPDGWSPKQLSGYATKEECEADNSVNVCCFDEEEPKTFKIRVYETFSRVIEVKATDYNQAADEVRKILEKEPFGKEDSDGLGFN